MMLSGVPNMAFAIGYVNASWTLKVDLVCEHLCRLLAHMDTEGHTMARPELPAAEASASAPLLDFAAGYVQRSAHLMPRQGQGRDWQAPQDYRQDIGVLRDGPVTSPDLRLSSPERVADLVPIAS